ncbi:hypothetical protein CHS0354_026550 [Potamilus streckersoni]|uniref:Geminin n=1 Tax=Potamilus streckersoni TaxID=2493646 RepID=A0AAE0RQ60_9BIVA|nr:hypothetical protein CHS0354_026550 [Potamilus streckersoni]
MSISTMFNFGSENISMDGQKSSVFQFTSTPERDASSGERKILQPIENVLVGKKPITMDKTSQPKFVKQKISGREKTYNIYEDRDNTRKDKETQTDDELYKAKLLSQQKDFVHNDSGVGDGEIDPEALELMVNEPIPDSYWQQLAEERRVALNDSLKENEQLIKEIDELKEENAKLSKLASQAEYFADILKTVMGDDEDSSQKGNEVLSREEDDENNVTSGGLKDQHDHTNESDLEQLSDSVETSETTKEKNGNGRL